MRTLAASARQAQQGVAAVLAAIWLGVALVCLMGLDVGHVFWQKRELQKLVDLAAMAGASGDLPTACATATQAGEIARQNGLKSSDTLTPLALEWSATGAAATGRLNACRVTVARSVPYFFVLNAQGNTGRTVQATATAVQKSQLARLSVRSTLVTLDSTQSAILSPVVGGLLGGSLTVSALGWNGLLGTEVNLLRFLDALAVRANVQAGGYEQVLAANTRVGVVLQAMVDALQQQGNTAAAALTALQAVVVTAQASAVNLQLAEILSLGTGLGQEALQTQLNAFDLVMALAQLANSKNAAAAQVTVPVLGVGNIAVKLKAIEPPQWAIGDPAKDVIEAQTAQVSLDTAVELNLAVAALKIALTADVGQGQARVTAYQCGNGAKSLSVQGRTGVATVKLGVTVTVLVIPLPVTITLPLQSQVQTLTYAAPPRLEAQPAWQSITQANVVTSLITALTGALGSLLQSVLVAVLSPITAILDALLNVVLGALGVDLARTDIGAQLNCGRQAVLVL